MPLFIGVIASPVSAMPLMWVLAEWAVGRRAVQTRPKMSGVGTVGGLRTWQAGRTRRAVFGRF
ncbi:hypothetical protein [Microtetraspora fusca]|uniref:Uncharacterized protein n=1 Tax=Microtetraspora fusca TaxID=1997 RepID=A0ABW6V323_MICFU|nr:hypothetical protein [Microtetraspora fusca]